MFYRCFANEDNKKDRINSYNAKITQPFIDKSAVYVTKDSTLILKSDHSSLRHESKIYPIPIASKGLFGKVEEGTQENHKT